MLVLLLILVLLSLLLLLRLLLLLVLLVSHVLHVHLIVVAGPMGLVIVSIVFHHLVGSMKVLGDFSGHCSL